MRSKQKSGFKHFEVSIHLEASNTFRVQAATRKRAEGKPGLLVPGALVEVDLIGVTH